MRCMREWMWRSARLCVLMSIDVDQSIIQKTKTDVKSTIKSKRLQAAAISRLKLGIHIWPRATPQEMLVTTFKCLNIYNIFKCLNILHFAITFCLYLVKKTIACILSKACCAISFYTHRLPLSSISHSYEVLYIAVAPRYGIRYNTSMILGRRPTARDHPVNRPMHCSFKMRELFFISFFIHFIFHFHFVYLKLIYTEQQFSNSAIVHSTTKLINRITLIY